MNPGFLLFGPPPLRTSFMDGPRGHGTDWRDTHRVSPCVEEHDEVLGGGVAVLDLALVAVPVHRQARLVEQAHIARGGSGLCRRRRASCNDNYCNKVDY